MAGLTLEDIKKQIDGWEKKEQDKLFDWMLNKKRFVLASDRAIEVDGKFEHGYPKKITVMIIESLNSKLKKKTTGMIFDK